jgi:hypothetical protein
MSHFFKTTHHGLAQTDAMHMLLMLASLTQAPDVTALSWFAGCWRQESSSRTVDEVWMAPQADGMLGMSRTVAKGRIVEYEFIQLRAREGKIVYIAKPSGQPEATFTATTVGPREAIFENPAHGFPQRIIYRLQADGSIAARVEGTAQGKTRGVDFPMKRVACP